MKIAVQILTAAALAAFGAGSALAQTVGFATGPQATPTNAAGAAVAKIANELGGLSQRLRPHISKIGRFQIVLHA